MTFVINLEIKGLDEELRALENFDWEFKRENRRTARVNADLMSDGMKAVAPLGEGVYLGSITDDVRVIDENWVQAVAGTDVRSSKGFPYPRALEESVRYHYRSTRFKGRRTAGQMSRMFMRLKKVFENNLAGMADRLRDTLVVK